jgi:hypothetical protein
VLGLAQPVDEDHELVRRVGEPRRERRRRHRDRSPLVAELSRGGERIAPLGEPVAVQAVQRADREAAAACVRKRRGPARGRGVPPAADLQRGAAQALHRGVAERGDRVVPTARGGGGGAGGGERSSGDRIVGVANEVAQRPGAARGQVPQRNGLIGWCSHRPPFRYSGPLHHLVSMARRLWARLGSNQRPLPCEGTRPSGAISHRSCVSPAPTHDVGGLRFRVAGLHRARFGPIQG